MLLPVAADDWWQATQVIVLPHIIAVLPRRVTERVWLGIRDAVHAQ